MGRTFPCAERARAVAEASRAVKETFRPMWDAHVDRNDPKEPLAVAWKNAAAAFHAAIDRAYPPGFWADLTAVRAGDRSGLPAMIAFLEADPWFFRSGYIKAMALRAIKRFALSRDEAERLRRVVLDMVERRDGREFRDYCRLARSLATPEFRREIERRAASVDPAVARRARWVLEALDQKG